MSEDTSITPGTVLIRYANLFGALVIVMDTKACDSWPLTWFCQGCMARNEGLNLSIVRERANGHAATCRALPPTTPATA